MRTAIPGSPQDEANKRLAEIDRLMEEIREIAAQNNDVWIRFKGPTYGMGGWVEDGEWVASSGSC